MQDKLSYQNGMRPIASFGHSSSNHMPDECSKSFSNLQLQRDRVTCSEVCGSVYLSSPPSFVPLKGKGGKTA